MMIRILLLSCLLGLAALPAAASERSGLEFGFPSGLGVDVIDPSEVDGYALSWTRRSGAGRGLRLGLTLGFRAEEDAGTYEQGAAPLATREETDRTEIALRLQKLFLTTPRRGVGLVLGVGPMVGYTDMDRWDTSISGGTAVIQRHTETSVLRAGLAWDLGVEWEAAPQLSVGARYRWTLAYERSEQVSTDTGDSITDRRVAGETDAVSLEDGGTADLVVTVWF